jgi:hypothetical protein
MNRNGIDGNVVFGLITRETNSAGLAVMLMCEYVFCNVKQLNKVHTQKEYG